MPERILIVTGDASGEPLDEAFSADGFAVTAVAAHAALSAARGEHPDLVVLDVSGAELDGVALCRALRADRATSALGVIVVGDQPGLADRLAALDAGADDYLTRPMEPVELSARVRAALRRSRQLRASPITGLPGQFDLERELRRLLDDTDAAFAVVLTDLDHFRAYNQRYGFERGDEAIAATGRLLEEAVAGVTSSPHFLVHLCGDDFALLVEPHSVAELCDDVIAAFAQAAPLLHDPEDAERGWIEITGRQGGQHRYPLLSMSIGVASNFLRPITSPAEAMALAAETRAVAKAVVGSAWRVDRRRS